MTSKAIRGLLFVGLGLVLVHCSDDTKKVTSAAGGEPNGGEAPASGGSNDGGDTAGAPTTSGGMPGSAGEPSIEAGSGGTSPTSGAPGESGAGGELGMAGGGSCEPTDCCSGDEPTCEAGWDATCGSNMSDTWTCCDSATGISRTCGYASGGIERSASVCVNDCTGRSFGTDACSGCTDAQDPSCDSDWTAECASGKVYCSDLAAGFRMSCEESGYNRTIAVECLCDASL